MAISFGDIRHRRVNPVETSARPLCRGCGRALVAWVRQNEPGGASRVAVAGSCFCDRITVLPTRTRVLILQHPREERVAIGTARMAQLALPNSLLRVGLDFAGDPEVLGLLAQTPRPHVLFPGPEAVPVGQLPRDRDITLIVLDGTWWQARKLLKLNPAIAALPRVAFRPHVPSAYVIRREPTDLCVSTIEALAAVLKVLEPDGDRFERLLDPFHAMVERQRWFQAEVCSSRHHAGGRPVVSPLTALAARLSAEWPRLVCVHGEANAWPRHHDARDVPETVHWVAHRPATAETFEAVIAPRRALAEATPEHVELSAARLRAGGTLQQWHDAWTGFTRPGDILVMWGTYYRDLAAADGLPLAAASMNLRDEVSRALRLRFGDVEASLNALDATPRPLALAGRGGRRLAALVGVLESLRLRRAVDGSRIRSITGAGIDGTRHVARVPMPTRSRPVIA